jgi:hypothetical protein
METVKERKDKNVNYLVTNYDDLKDVVTTVERMIADNEEIRDNPTLRKEMRLDVTPLKANAGIILKIQLHDAMILQPG